MNTIQAYQTAVDGFTIAQCFQEQERLEREIECCQRRRGWQSQVSARQARLKILGERLHYLYAH